MSFWKLCALYRRRQCLHAVVEVAIQDHMVTDDVRRKPSDYVVKKYAVSLYRRRQCLHAVVEVAIQDHMVTDDVGTRFVGEDAQPQVANMC